MSFVQKVRLFLIAAAKGYEPAAVRGFVAAVFALFVGLGLPQVAELSDEVDSILKFLAYSAPLIAGLATRFKVTPVKRLKELGTDVKMAEVVQRVFGLFLIVGCAALPLIVGLCSVQALRP